LVLGDLARRWDEVVGERLAHESQPVRLADGGLLVVRVSSSAWGAQVRFLADEVRRNANRAIGADVVQDVRIVVDAGSGTG
jgi:predicted nucleic acid-binding Zn ribbon protein